LHFQHIPTSLVLAAEMQHSGRATDGSLYPEAANVTHSRGGFMTSAISNTFDTTTYAAGELTELVRGCDKVLLEQLVPLVRRQNVSLDLGRVERIDAAGIAALISLYGSARDAGHCFSVSNASARVAEILALVGLDRILLSQNVIYKSHSGKCFERPAA
jgi:anti-anti-sigma factor